MTNTYDNFVENHRTVNLARCLILVILIVVFCLCATAIRDPQNSPFRSNVPPYFQETPNVPATPPSQREGSARSSRTE